MNVNQQSLHFVLIIYQPLYSERFSNLKPPLFPQIQRGLNSTIPCIYQISQQAFGCAIFQRYDLQIIFLKILNQYSPYKMEAMQNVPKYQGSRIQKLLDLCCKINTLDFFICRDVEIFSNMLLIFTTSLLSCLQLGKCLNPLSLEFVQNFFIKIILFRINNICDFFFVVNLMINEFFVIVQIYQTNKRTQLFQNMWIL
eukprot:TRINITY_DN5889_c0_g2_i1.p3 TRINITY_DN5889_c0_g2~~TRINITY_DN5889_c0_g2_i1.p3  ORF type:complete len:198 (-),score=-6.12 TRINITY_DN5889_c0_g2_i1:217-810(-)